MGPRAVAGRLEAPDAQCPLLVLGALPPPLCSPYSDRSSVHGPEHSKVHVVIHRHSRRAHPQPAQRRSGAATRSADRVHGPVGLGQILAGVRHDLCRGAASLRRVPVGLCAAIPVDDGKARSRAHRRPVAGDRDRAEIHFAQSALDRRHGHRNLRSPATAVRACRRSAVSRSWRGAGGSDREPDGGSGTALTRGHAAHADRADDRRTQRRAPAGHGSVARTGIRARSHRRRGDGARSAAQARQQAQAHHRGRRGSREGAARYRSASGRELRDCAATIRRHRPYRIHGRS